MKYLNTLPVLLILTSCSYLSPKMGPEYTENKVSVTHEFYGEREIASDSACTTNLKKFFENEVTEDELNIALKERKLISFKDKMVIVNYPKVEWLNNTKKSLITRIKNWNRNQYPLFYLDQSDKFAIIAKSYSDLMTKELNNAITDDEKSALTILRDWITTYKNYQSDLDLLLEERISLQYNINMLKEIKLNKGEVRDIKVTIKKGGAYISEVITLRAEDRNLEFTLKNYKDQIKELDGKLSSFGKIQERVIKQAMAKDVVTIVQRELEHSVKNTDSIAPEISAHLDELNSLLKNADLEPSSYGVYKITNQVFSDELGDLFSRSGDEAVKEVTNKNQFSIRGQIEKFFGKKKETVETAVAVVENVAKAVENQTKDAGTLVTKSELKREGPLKKIYAKIATFTPYQKFSAATKLGVVGYGAYRFFWMKKEPTSMVTITTPTQLNPEPMHDEQVQNTQKVDQANSDGNTSVVEVHLENLLKSNNKKVP